MTITNSSQSTTAMPFKNCEHGEKHFTKNISDIILNANSNRKYAAFINTSTVEITLVLGSKSKAFLNKGIILRPGGSYEININNLYVGEISAISSANSKLSFVEGD